MRPPPMATPEYDALIVGARVAGATVAARLAGQGRKVPLVDRDKFPSDTISTHALAFNAVDSLRRLGVLLRIEAAGFRRIFRHRAWVEDICIEAPAALRPPFEQTVRRRGAAADCLRRSDPPPRGSSTSTEAEAWSGAWPGVWSK